ncbi:MAG: cysteine biosynthesis protein CysZ, partial [Rhodobacteraceae bacterium]|nr:cysteine biosynthesis protein CysZ [Paracoccaceae bacterium]
NGVLIGREYFDLVAARHCTLGERRAMYRTYRLRILGVGFLTALLLLVPIMNLAVPLIGMAAMIHLFHGLHGIAIPNTPTIDGGIS